MWNVKFARRALACIILTALWLPATAQSAQLPAASGAVVLRIDGDIENTTADGVAALDLASLEALPTVSMTTSTPWTVGLTTFEGVLLKDVLLLVGAKGQSITVAAINDYSVTFPAEDEIGLQPIIAYKVNGELMSVRDKGPLWIVYPYDQNPAAQSETYYGRSIWQLVHITVTP